MKFINFDTVIKCNKTNVINKNKFTPQHCSSFLKVGKTGIGKTNFLLNILNLNPIWDKSYIYANTYLGYLGKLRRILYRIIEEFDRPCSNNIDNKYQFK